MGSWRLESYRKHTEAQGKIADPESQVEDLEKLAPQLLLDF